MQLFKYSKIFWIRLGLTLFALLIAAVSLWYTHNLVDKLAKREQSLIDLYAKGLEAAAKSDNSGNNLAFLFQEIIQANTSVPVILAINDSTPVSYRNINIPDTLEGEQLKKALLQEMRLMQSAYPPIVIEILPGLYNYIYYKNSVLLQQLIYYPYIQLIFITLFVFLGYLVLNNTMRSEQNYVWVGMAKETAHQLGTPISSLIAWVEYMRSEPNIQLQAVLTEMEKDLNRLQTVTSRFSQIGSKPIVKPVSFSTYLSDTFYYLKTRISGKIYWKIDLNALNVDIKVAINQPLMDWTLENLVKNATDAMDGVGEIGLVATVHENQVYIDISDTGKGLKREQYTRIFKPGYTTKQRGWGLGLSLAKRIVESYHSGKIFVKHSEPNRGTTFRIVLNIWKPKHI